MDVPSKVLSRSRNTPEQDHRQQRLSLFSLSVGVGRQYAGVVGKVDNCQVGVYVSFCNDTSATLVNERLFLPEAWAEDTER